MTSMHLPTSPVQATNEHRRRHSYTRSDTTIRDLRDWVGWRAPWRRGSVVEPVRKMERCPPGFAWARRVETEHACSGRRRVESGTDRKRGRLQLIASLVVVVAVPQAGSSRIVGGSCHSCGMSCRQVSGAHNIMANIAYRLCLVTFHSSLATR